MIDSARLAISLILASTLLISGIAKLRSGRFVADLANYRILPLRLVIPVATAMPPFEIALAALVLAWFTSAVPIYIAAVVLTLFATAMVVNLLRGRTIACGCRGSNQPISWSLVASDLALAVVTSAIATTRPAVGGLTILEGIATVGAVAVAVLTLRLVQQLRQIRSAARLLGLGPLQASP